MDEPLGALDEMTRSAMRYELLRIWESRPTTMVFITHSIEEAVLMGDRVLVLASKPGRILADRQIGLARPRRRRSAEFERQVDELYSLIV